MKKLLTILALLAITCSCKEEAPAPTINPTEITQLDEMPLTQLRFFLKGAKSDWRADTDMSKGVPAPPVQKPHNKMAKTINLVTPEDLTLGKMSVAEAINNRRSRRLYTDDPLTNEELSYLLWCTQGISHLQENDKGDITYHLRTVPSGGSSHPFVTYLAINRVAGIQPGLYRFLPLEHKLVFLGTNDTIAEEIGHACYGQPHMKSAAVVFIWTTIPKRTEWKYSYIAHKMIAMDAGHMGQNLYLAGESIDVGVCANLGFDQLCMDLFLGVDGEEEFTIYTAAVGKIEREAYAK